MILVSKTAQRDYRLSSLHLFHSLFSLPHLLSLWFSLSPSPSLIVIPLVQNVAILPHFLKYWAGINTQENAQAESLISTLPEEGI